MKIQPVGHMSYDISYDIASYVIGRRSQVINMTRRGLLLAVIIQFIFSVTQVFTHSRPRPGVGLHKFYV